MKMWFYIIRSRLLLPCFLVATLCFHTQVIAQTNELPPLKLMSPLSNISLESLAGEADSAYSNKQFKIAESGFRSILELDSGNRRALFRLGNIFQQLGNNEQAMAFYRQASQATEFSQQLDEFAEKGLINIALLSAEQLKSALSELDKRKPSAKNASTVQGLIDELSDSQSLISARVASLQKSSVLHRTQTVTEVALPEMINGNVKHSLKPPPRVTYSQQANPSEESLEVTYVRGAPPKALAPRSIRRTETVYKKVVKPVPSSSQSL
jgi:tetratricopeptide (TPR) repeat protein